MKCMGGENLDVPIFVKKWLAGLIPFDHVLGITMIGGHNIDSLHLFCCFDYHLKGLLGLRDKR